MNPKNKPPFAHTLAQQTKQPAQRAQQFKPVVAQFKTAQNVKRPVAPPVYRPQEMPRVLQTKRSSGQMMQVGQKPAQPIKGPVTLPKAGARPSAPPVFKPQHIPVVLQRKPIGPPSIGLRNAVQPKVMTQPARMHMPAASSRPPVVQMAARASRKAALKEEKKEKKAQIITAGGLEKDDYLYVEAASGGVAALPAHTEKKFDVRILKLVDVDYQQTAKNVKLVLTNPTRYRNMTSDCPIHKNDQRRLPHYSEEEVQPNLEYTVPGLGGSRIVVDVTGGRVYLSHHYGDKSARENKIDPKYKELSAFVELDSTWDTTAILADARTWWAIVVAAMA